MQAILYAPPSYWSLSEIEKQKICNGCGAKGGMKFIDGSFKEPCNIHDYMYQVGETDDDKMLADVTFYVNMQNVANATKNPFKRLFLKARAKTFYKAVKLFGEEAFYKSKVEALQKREVKI